MSDLKTVLTYDRPSEAEVDKSFLGSRGIAVYLMNGNMARNEIGPAFYIQLQVNVDDFEAARNTLREANPQRFGSPERVAEIDRAVKRLVWFFFAAAIPAGLIALWLIPAIQGPPRPAPVHRIIPDLHLSAAMLVAVLAGVGSASFAARKARS